MYRGDALVRLATLAMRTCLLQTNALHRSHTASCTQVWSRTWCLMSAVVHRENRFLLEERDLMQQQLQQLAERSPSRQLTQGIGMQGSETPFGTPCTRGAARPCRRHADVS